MPGGLPGCGVEMAPLPQDLCTNQNACMAMLPGFRIMTNFAFAKIKNGILLSVPGMKKCLQPLPVFFPHSISKSFLKLASGLGRNNASSLSLCCWDLCRKVSHRGRFPSLSGTGVSFTFISQMLSQGLFADFLLPRIWVIHHNSGGFLFSS